MPFYNDIPYIGKHLKSNQYLNELSPESSKKNTESLLKNVGFAKNKTVTLKTDTFEAVSNKKVMNIDGLAGAKGPGGLTLHDKISKDNNSANTIRSIISDALAPQPDFIKAKEKYGQDMEALNQLALQVPQKHKAQDLIMAFQEFNKDARDEIIKQHEFEKNALKSNLNQNIQHLQTTLGLGQSDNDKEMAEQSIKAMIAELEAAQKKQLDEFDKVNKEMLTNLHNAAGIDIAQKNFIAKIRQNNPEMQAELERIAAEKRKAEDNGNTIVRTTDKDISISNITLDDVKTIKSITGSTMQKQADGSWSFSVSRHISSPLHHLDLVLQNASFLTHISSPLYHLDPRQCFKTDCATLANAIKATGSKGIEFNVDFSPPKIAEEKARQAWEAAREAGFKDEDITINLNGSPVKAEDLFKGHEARFKIAQTKGAQNDEIRNEIIENIRPQLSKGNLESVKQSIEAINKAKQSPVEDTTNQPRP